MGDFYRAADSNLACMRESEIAGEIQIQSNAEGRHRLGDLSSLEFGRVTVREI